MPATNVKTIRQTKTDSKEIAIAEVKKRIAISVGAYVVGVNRLLWAIADDMQWLTQEMKFTKDNGQQWLREEFCKQHGIQWDGKSKNKTYESFSSTVVRIGLVGSLSSDLYKKYRDSGDKFTTVWATITGPGKKRLDAIAKGELSRQTKEENQKKEKEELDEAVNVSDIKHVETNTYHPEKRETKAWVAEQKNPDKEWIKGCRKIAKESPELFIEMIESCVKFHHLSEKVLALVKKELRLG